MNNPQHIRKDIADLLKMDDAERKELNTMSMTALIQSLIHYTQQLEKGYSLKEKNKINVSEFILKYKKAYIEHLEKQTPRPSKYEALLFSQKIIDRALKHYDDIEKKRGNVSARDLIDVINLDLENWTQEEFKKLYLV